jgi:phage baseplate assembly protein W
MPSINFSQPVRSTENTKYVFSDIHLDIQEDKSSKNNKSDIKADYDVYAIKNSIRNIFNTSKGERILEPEFGISLEKYLFEPLNTSTGYNIGNEIQTGITKYEPRVTVLNIKVIVREDFPGYEINVALFIPKLNINTIINGAVTPTGFNIV